MEYIDYFDGNMDFLGVATRDDVHKKGLWHQTFHGWVLREENKKKYVVFQIRSSCKESYPGMLDVTASGHLLSNEKKEDGFRELKEEIGLNIEDQQKTYLGIRITIGESIYKQNREFSHVYLIEDNTPICNYKLQAGEVEGVIEIEINAGLRLFSGEADTINCIGYTLGNRNKIFKITKDSFVKRIDNYYYKIFIMADRFFSNNMYLTI